MPIYEYRCPRCGEVQSISCAPDSPEKQTWDRGAECPVCRATLRRKFSFTTPSFFQPHYNHSTGAWVESKRQLDEQFKVASETATLRTGLEHKLVAHDVRDVSPEDFGVTDEGLKSTHDAQVSTGLKDSKGRFTF